MNRISIAELGRRVELDECEHSISSLENDRPNYATRKHAPSAARKEITNFSFKSREAVSEKVVLGFSSLNDLSLFKTTIKDVYLQVNIVHRTITAPFSSEEIERAFLYGATLRKVGVNPNKQTPPAICFLSDNKFLHRNNPDAHFTTTPNTVSI